MEILSPAGNFEAFLAAVHNGADAVYLGGKTFGARAFAGNFALEEIAEAVKYAHLRESYWWARLHRFHWMPHF